MTAEEFLHSFGYSRSTMVSLEVALQAVFLARIDAEKDLLKKAIDARIHNNNMAVDECDLASALSREKVKEGDKVKLIIVKEEKQQ